MSHNNRGAIDDDCGASKASRSDEQRTKVENQIPFHELHAMSENELLDLREEKSDRYDEYKNPQTPFQQNQLITASRNIEKIETTLREKGAF